MKRYLIISESEDFGEFIEIHTNLEKAIERASRYFELAFNPPVDYPQLDLEFKPFGDYKIHDQFNYSFKVLGGACNGFYSTYVIEISDNFNPKHFALLRSNPKSFLLN